MDRLSGDRTGMSRPLRPTIITLFILSLLVLLCTSPSQVEAARNEVRCSSMDIRNSPKWGRDNRSELECTIVEGDFTLSMMTEEDLRDEMFPVFHRLREITGSILVFQLKGLTSLGKIFPNLRVIGGYSLVMNYALVIYQNQDLRNVGLSKLSVIKNGGVRIAENSRLCYTRNINWDNMIVGNLRDVILDTAESQCQDQCVVANETRCYRPRQNAISCWNGTECQTYCPHHRYENGTFGPGCSESGEICHPYCLGGCSVPNDPGACHTCNRVEIHGICAETCPEGMYEFMGRRCLTHEQCLNSGPILGAMLNREETAWKAFLGKCHYECPIGYEEDPNNNRTCVKCVGHCPKKCRGDETVDSVGATLKYKNCNVIEGSLEIEIRIGNEVNAEKFSEAFGELEEITGYLMVRFSSVFVSLHMFKKLRVIHGNQLWRNYSLVVFDNQNLRELFNLKRQSLTILNGRVQFQNNRMLCYKKIETFLKHIGKLDEVEDADVSTYSNGERAVCNELPLEVEVAATEPELFTVRWVPFNTSDMDYRKFIGYQVYYKKVDKIDEEMSIDDDRSACADTWKMHFAEAPQPEDQVESGASLQTTGTLITEDIEPNTLYAFYVQTRVVNHPGARNAISKVNFVKTLFGIPDPPKIRIYRARGSDRIEMQWDLPASPQGVITHYTVQWQPPESEHSDALNGCSDEVMVHKPVIETLSKKTNKPGTCSIQEGCCDCSSLASRAGPRVDDVSNGGSSSNSMDVFTEEMEMGREERDAFENSIQNRVFVQNCEIHYDPLHCGPRPAPERDPAWPPTSTPHAKRRRHAGSYSSGHPSKNSNNPYNNKRRDNATTGEKGAKPRSRRHINNYTDTKMMNPTLVERITAGNETAFNLSVIDVSDPNFPEDFRYSGKINVTGTYLLLTGLPHFTEYVILISACQDTTQPRNSCSARPAWVTVRTAAIATNDLVAAETVHVLNVTDGKENDRRLNWSPPEAPNGHVLAYRVKLFRDGVDTTPLFKCVNRTEFADEQGITFHGLAGGSYSVEIRAVTLAGVGLPTLVKDVFTVYSPLISKKALLFLVLAFVCALALIGAIGIYIFRCYCQKYSEDKIQQLLSSNPEYLSQIDVYKKDEWELPRDRIIMGRKIGEGTFGQVMKGNGLDVVSTRGVRFGECAVKTISETSANRDRLHFLVEASVMKQFDTNFIVKLYGVVSDPPVFVVMELMEKGNLRDFLRAHRPGAEENVGNLNTLPTEPQFSNWAAQIADGMAYLESIRFCHRDLAARNCMVAADESVKIGDFGMARDIYYHEYYQPHGKRLMPIRWMSPESLKDGKFTTKSDVWSYGVVLYEMLTLGQQPYAGLGNDQVFNFVSIQRRVMSRPMGCPDYWYTIMRACWQYDPRDRPFFWQIVDFLAPGTDDSFHERSFVLNSKDIKRDKDPFEFNEEWRDNESSAQTESVAEEDVGMEIPLSNKHTSKQRRSQASSARGGQKAKEQKQEDPDDDSSCSCSECSEENKSLPGEVDYEESMFPADQKRKIHKYLSSMMKPSPSNDLGSDKTSQRDLEYLLPLGSRAEDDGDEEDVEGDYVEGFADTLSPAPTPDTFAQPLLDPEDPRRPTLDEQDKSAIRQAMKGVHALQTAEWMNQQEAKGAGQTEDSVRADLPPTAQNDYLTMQFTNNDKTSTNGNQ